MAYKEEYNPETCFTAAQMREFGLYVPGHIPDDAWILKEQMIIEVIGPFRLSKEDGSVERISAMQISFHQRNEYDVELEKQEAAERQEDDV